jgi:hypothetical protein
LYGVSVLCDVCSACYEAPCGVRAPQGVPSLSSPFLCAFRPAQAPAGSSSWEIDGAQAVAAVPCGPGLGLAWSHALGLVFTTDSTANSLSAFRADGAGFPLVGSWGSRGTGRLRFDFCVGGGASGALCFLAPRGAGPVGAAGRGTVAAPAPPTLLVTDAGNDRVVELGVDGVAAGGAPVPLRTFGSGTGAAPRGVAACAALVAVSGWSHHGSGDHVVTLYDAVTLGRVRVLGAGAGLGPSAGQLWQPAGLCFRDGGGSDKEVVVADKGNFRVSVFAAGTGAFVAHVASDVSHGLCGPTAVAAVPGDSVGSSEVGGDSGGGAGGSDCLLIVDEGNHRVVCVPRADPVSALGQWGQGPAQFAFPSALEVSADGGLVVVREEKGGRLQVLQLPQ